MLSEVYSSLQLWRPSGWQRVFFIATMATAMVAADANAEQIIARTDQDWLVLTVIDGDTFKTAPPWLISSLQPLSVRIRGIDTPEKGRWADCQSERRLARLAARHTQNKLAKAHRIELRNIDWGKYGGRVVADVWVDGDSLAQSLIKAGLGVVWHKGQRPDWCSGLARDYLSQLQAQ